MSLLELFLTFLEWLQSTALAKAIIEMRWSMPIFLTFHAAGMTLLIGAIIVSLRLLGLLMPRRPVPEIAEELWRWSLVGIVIMLTSGLLLFFSGDTALVSQRCFSHKDGIPFHRDSFSLHHLPQGDSGQ